MMMQAVDLTDLEIVEESAVQSAATVNGGFLCGFACDGLICGLWCGQ